MRLASKLRIGSLLLLGACNSILGAADEYRLVDVDAGPCRLNTDCTSGGVCIFSTCGPACVGDGDCLPEFRCLATDNGAACVHSSAALCSAICPPGTTCSDGVCRNECNDSDKPCLTGQTCSGGVCVGSPDHEGGGAGGSGGSFGTPPTGGSSGSGNGGGGSSGGGSSNGGGGSGGSSPGPVCGNGVLEGTERCDDQDLDPGDGCNATCRVESGWSCDDGEPTNCDEICGDGRLVGVEAEPGGCDDDETVGGDGCSASCTVEPEWFCMGQPSICAHTCGNEKLDGSEECDDPNEDSGDGCFACVQEPGWTCDGEPSVCMDIDECMTDNGGCDPLTTCMNTIGSRTCSACPSGYEGTGESGCIDIDECMTDNGGCDPLTTCTNTPAGSRTCGACPSGYTGTGASGCLDINECMTNNGGCSANANCTNTPPGSRTCTCKNGYEGTGLVCTDINECMTNNGGCDPLTTCTNTPPGSRTCSACPSGYSGTGATGCTDINECLTNNGGCDPLTTCTNTPPGSRTCGACPSGYTGTGASGCVDINECNTNNGGCHNLATCTNTPPGSRTCTCNTGYTGNGITTCNDIDECAMNTDNCDANATCTNLPAGSFTCTCNSGYTGNGVTCSLIIGSSCIGAAGNECQGQSCCTTVAVPAASGFTLGQTVESPTSQATVAAFTMDKYEVTMGRFQRFVTAYDAWRGAGNPKAGAGAHPLIANSGWQSQWPLASPASALTSGLLCDATMATWSAANQQLPINCLNWYEAFAFCIWDGQRLPTEAEWESAAGAGTAGRLYPWGNSPVPDNTDGSRAVYNCLGNGNAADCVLGDVLSVGSKPMGATMYGHRDMGGSVAEWVLDFFQPYTPVCSNCAAVTTGTARVMRGGSWYDLGANLRSAKRANFTPTSRGADYGFRCAR